MRNFDHLKIIVMESPYDTLNQSEFNQKLFSQVIDLKIRGYQHMHQSRVAPVDATDFIGTHLLVCDYSNPDKIKVLMGYKAVNYGFCREMGYDFPMLKIVEKAGDKACYDKLSEIIYTTRARGEEISYDTSWTLDPELRDDKQLREVLKELTCALLYHHHHDYNISTWLTFGICKFKTDEYFFKLGAQEISTKPFLKQPFLNGADARSMYCHNQFYTQFAQDIAKKYRSMWDNRLHIGINDERKVKKAA